MNGLYEVGRQGAKLDDSPVAANGKRHGDM
jgi:hypothetical protein